MKGELDGKNKKVISEQYIKKKEEKNQCNKIMAIIGVALMMIMFFSFLVNPILSIFIGIFYILSGLYILKKQKGIDNKKIINAIFIMIGFWRSIVGILVVFGVGALLFYLVLLTILILRAHRR